MMGRVAWAGSGVPESVRACGHDKSAPPYIEVHVFGDFCNRNTKRQRGVEGV